MVGRSIKLHYELLKEEVKMIEPGALLIIIKDYDGLYEGQEVTLIHQQKEGMCLVRLSSIGVKWIPSSIIKLVS